MLCRHSHLAKCQKVFQVRNVHIKYFFNIYRRHCIIVNNEEMSNLIFGGNLFSEAVCGRDDLVRLLNSNLKNFQLVLQPDLTLTFVAQPVRRKPFSLFIIF